MGDTEARAQDRVFINYRRKDTQHVAGRVRDRIDARFGRDRVFMDVEDIGLGGTWRQEIEDADECSAVMLVLIGERWLEKDESGQRRIDDPFDPLRIEVESGLRHRSRVIPVLVDSARMPRAEDLPFPLRDLPEHHAFRVQHESFSNDANYLLEFIEKYLHLESTPPGPGPRPGPGPGPDPRPKPVSSVARWLAVVPLVATLLVLLALRDGARDAVLASRPDLPTDGPWASLLWLLPALPVALAAVLAATRKAPGIAGGCVAGAAIWVCTSLVFVRWRAPDASQAAHLLVLVLLLAGLAGLLVAHPELRARMAPNRADRATVAVLLMLAAMFLRVRSGWVASLITGTDLPPTDWARLLSNPPFWLSVLVPLLICLPAALLLGNAAQAQALRTTAVLQIVYPFVLRVVTFDSAAEQDGAAYLAVANAVFLLGCVCILLAVRAGQRGSPGRG